MPGTKRKKTTVRAGSYKKSKSKLTKAYKKVVRAKTKRKMRGVVKKAKATRLATTPFLRQPMSTLVRFKASHCATYRYGATQQSTSINSSPDLSHVFPVAGIEINQNDIYDPFNTGTNHNAPGFDAISRQYGKWRVIGSKTTYRVRRMGAHVPYNTSQVSANNLMAPTVQENTVTSIASGVSKNVGGGIGVGPSIASNMGGLLDPANADPLMAILVDRNAYQDTYSQVSEATMVVDYAHIRQYQHLKGLQWRELKAGAGSKCSIVKKWSERGLDQASAHGRSPQEINTGSFHNEAGSWLSGGNGPTQKDPMRLFMKPFDGMSAAKNEFANARFMITIDIEYLVKVTEPRYTYSQP